MKLSIIIPAYNAGRFIEKCINSCEVQDISRNEYELIIVDDGSTDNTKEVIAKMQSVYANIKYQYQENARQGAARNRGLDISDADYIWFVDADDWIAENCLGHILKKLEEEKLDGVVIGHATCYEEKTKIWAIFDEHCIVSGKHLLAKNKFLISPTYTIWKRSYWVENNLRFIEHIFHEDSELCPRLYYDAEKIGFINDTCYFVYPNMNSTTRGINPKRAYDLVLVTNELCCFLNRVKEPAVRSVLTDYISMTINSSFYNVYMMTSDNIAKLDKLWHESSSLYRVLINSSRMKYKLEGLLFTLFPFAPSKVYRLLQIFNSNPGGMNEQKKLLKK